MRRSIKKGAILLAAALMAIPMTVAAAENAAVADVPAIVQENGVTSGTMGFNNGIHWSYDAAIKTLNITGEDSGFIGRKNTELDRVESAFCTLCGDVEKVVFKDCKLAGISMYALAHLQNLKEVTFDNFDTSELTSLSGMFSGCSSLESLDLSSFNTSNVDSMTSMFKDCSSLKTLNISSFDTSKVESMCMMFENCSSLESLDVSSFNTKNVKDMWYMFCGCSSVKDLDVSNFNTENVTSMEKMFSGCASLESLDLSNFNTSKVTRMWCMFSDCTALKTIDVSSFDTSNVEQMFSMFSECSSLESLDLSNFDTSKVTSLSGMFANNYAMKTVDMSSFNTENVAYMDSMFMSCYVLENLDVSNFDTSNVKDMNYMFRSCKALESLDVSNFDTSNVTDMSNMFMSCESLESLDVSNFDTSNVTNMSYMLMECDSLKRLDISSFDMSKVANANYMLLQCDNLNTIITPQSMANGITVDFTGKFHDAAGNELTEISPADCNKILIAWENGSRNMTVEADYKEVTVDNPLQLKVVVEEEAQPVEVNADYVWTVEDESVVTVSDTGVVTGVGVGETTVTCVHKVDSFETATYEVAVKVPFPDIKAKDWQYPFVVYAYENNLMSGKGDGTFGMNDKLTRAEFVTVLYSYTGKPDVTYEEAFTDVKATDWFATPVVWAKKEGVTAGNPDGTFGVSNKITREQLVVMLYQYAKKNEVVSGEVTGDLTAYADTNKVSSWAREALTWAVQNNIMGGKVKDGATYLDPQGSTTRGECATMMMRYVELSNS